METQTENQTEETITDPATGKQARTFLYAFVSVNGEQKLVGPVSKPELRQAIDALGDDVKILRMIRGREQKFATKAVISFQ